MDNYQNHIFYQEAKEQAEQPKIVSEPQTQYRKQNYEMNLAYQFVAATNVSVFLTGKAGTGKTTFLRKLRELLPKRMVVLAPTGVAAINAGGQTIHSFFQFEFGPWIPGARRDTKRLFRMSDRKKDLIRTLDLLVIDEVSMVRADLLDQIDDALRTYRDRTKPFGGVQLLLIGDLMQLSPVAKDQEWTMLEKYYDTPYFFASRALKQLKYVTVELKHIYRQADPAFINLLAYVRDGNITPEVMNALNARYIPNFRPTEKDWIRLTTHNWSAQRYNEDCMAMLPGSIFTFAAKVEKDFPESIYPADANLQLKEGAQVMFIKNDPSGCSEYYNGLIGTVLSFNNNGTISVAVEQESRVVNVTPVEWENTKYELDPESKMIKERVEGTFTQYPLRTAWAITVHKSQGLTFEHAVLDINASFTHGQVYVALSRCRSLEGMVLSNPILPGSVITDQRVNSFIEQEAREAENYERQLPSLKQAYMVSLLDELYSFYNLDSAWRWLMRVVDQYLSHQQPALLQQLKGIEPVFNQAIMAVAQNFRNIYSQQMEQTVGCSFPPALLERVKASAPYFWNKIQEILKPILKSAVINIDNRSVAEAYNKALVALKKEMAAKIMIFEALEEQTFSTPLYLNLRAKAQLGEAPKPSKSKRPRQDKPARQNHNAAPAPIEDIDYDPDYEYDDVMSPHQLAIQKRMREQELILNNIKKAKRKSLAQSMDETLALFRQGLSQAQIAEARKLAVSTIGKHLCDLVNRGDIELVELVPANVQQQIMEHVNKYTESFSLTQIKESLPEEITYDQIRLTLAAYRPKTTESE